MNNDLESIKVLHDVYDAARKTIAELHRAIGAQHRYIVALEEQLEPEVIEEIRKELSEQDQ